MRSIRKRDTLEIIIDTCSLGKNQLEAISRLIETTEKDRHGIFKQIDVVVPIQIATEVRQRIFPELLDAELMTRDRRNHLETFYHNHRGRIRIVETDISHAYKFLYAQFAASKVLDTPALARSVAEHANDLAKRYSAANGDVPTITPQDVGKFCLTIRDAKHEHELAFARSTLAIESAPPLRKKEAKEAAPRLMKQKSLGRHGKRLLEDIALPEKYILQAMYSIPEIYKEVSVEKEFKNFRKDKGERAIENYLFGNRSQTNPHHVSLIISDDAGARNSIQRLRSHSSNSIFVVSSWGLAVACKQMGLISRLDQIVDSRTISTISHRNRAGIANFHAGEAQTMDQILEPRIERKWANRLVQVLQHGYWEQKTKGIEGAYR